MNNTTYITQNQVLLNNLIAFYSKDDNMDKMLKYIAGDSELSLRIIDWFTTNYAKKYFTLYTIKNSEGDNVRFKVYMEYKLRLKGYGKDNFDPFCRWDRVNIPYKDGTFIETTLGQLNFFKWALTNKVLDYIEEHYTEILNDMNSRNSTSKRKGVVTDNAKTRKKREELSVSASKSIKKEEVEIVVKFH